jgi:O-acetyl-ADP-ribose deacetylase
VTTQILREYAFPSGQTFQIAQGDLTQQDVDGIVNAANAQLRHGGGVAGLIARRGGGEIQVASDNWVKEYGPVRHAEPAHTTAGDLPCQYIIHAVGPVWGEGDEDGKLADAVRGSLERADQLKLSSLALPAISTGIFGFPKGRAAKILYTTILHYIQKFPTSGIKLTRLVLFDRPTREAFVNEWDANFEKDER